MKTLWIVLALSIFIGVFLMEISNASEIVVEDADSVWSTSTSLSPELINTTANVSSRIISEYANSNFYEPLCYGNEINTANVTTRIIMEYANSNYYTTLSFPKELMNDTLPPSIINVSILSITNNSATIKWETNEFANGYLLYGKQSGIYANVEGGSLFSKNHTIIIKNLSSGTKYYFIIKCYDLSGNMAESIEYNFTTSGLYISVSGTKITHNILSFSASIEGFTSINYTWNFGDGSISYDDDPEHAYIQPGNYTIKLMVKDENGNSMNGSISIEIFQRKADLNNDGRMDIADAQIIMQYIVGITDLSYYQKLAADVPRYYNGEWISPDGIITIADAQIIMQSIVGLIPPIPAQP